MLDSEPNERSLSFIGVEDLTCEHELAQEPRREKSKRNDDEAGKSGHDRLEKGDVGEVGLFPAVCGRGVDKGDCRTIARPPGSLNKGVASSKGAADTDEISGVSAEC